MHKCFRFQTWLDKNWREAAGADLGFFWGGILNFWKKGPTIAFLDTFWKIFTKKSRFFGARSPLKVSLKRKNLGSAIGYLKIVQRGDTLGRQGIDPPPPPPPPPPNPPWEADYTAIATTKLYLYCKFWSLLRCYHHSFYQFFFIYLSVYKNNITENWSKNWEKNNKNEEFLWSLWSEHSALLAQWPALLVFTIRMIDDCENKCYPTLFKWRNA